MSVVAAAVRRSCCGHKQISFGVRSDLFPTLFLSLDVYCRENARHVLLKSQIARLISLQLLIDGKTKDKAKLLFVGDVG